MRYNPDTERSLNIDAIAAQCRTAVLSRPGEPPSQPERSWDCSRGDWNEAEPRPTESDDAAISDATINLWSACYKLRQLRSGTIPAATVASLKHDLRDVAFELQRLS
jgi:hypothetical protein